MRVRTFCTSDSASPQRPEPRGRRRPPSGPRPGACPAPEPLERRVLLSAGDLDPGFGAGGMSYLPLGAIGGADIAAGPGGKITVAASAWGRYDGWIALGRVNADGTPDETFGVGWAPAFWGVVPPDDEGIIRDLGTTGVVVQPDRRTVVAAVAHDDGYDPVTDTGTQRHAAFLARLLEDGSPDPSFGGDGIVLGPRGVVTLPMGDRFNAFAGLSLRGDGRIFTGQGATVLRFNADGTPDAAFGGGDGVADLPASGGGGTLDVIDLAAAADGSGDVLVLARVTPPAGAAPAVALVRLRGDGTPAASFGTGGLVVVPLGDAATFATAPKHLAVTPDGGVLLAGARGPAGNTGLAFARYTASGAPDRTFGAGGDDGDGVVTVAALPGANDVALAPGGRAVAVGNVGDVFSAVRVNADGSLDRTFGPGGADGDGVASYTLPPLEFGPDDFGGYAPALAAAVQGDGKILVASGSGVSDGWGAHGGVTLARLIADALAPAAPLVIQGTGGDDRISVDLAPDKANLVITVNGSAVTRPIAGISGIALSGLGGRDTLKVSAAIRIAATLDGGPGNDTLIGGGGNDTLVGGEGNDTLDGRGGADLFRGGAGVDTADYTSRRSPVFAGIGTAADDGEKGEGDNVFSDVENLWGGRGNDTLRGSSGDNKLVGGEGDDVLVGRGGRDTLLGGAGNDQLFARDSDRDTVDGGPGTDRADSDPRDLLLAVERQALRALRADE